MKEFSAILNAWRRRPKKALALATLVGATGSTYRRPGARLLLLDDGARIGSVSAGCLEHDVIGKAKEAAHSGQSVLLTYDTSADADIVFGTGLGCKGAVYILVEPLQPGSPAARFLDVLAKLFARGESTAAATVLKSSGNSPAVGQRFMLAAHGHPALSLGAPQMDALFEPMLKDTLASNRSTTINVDAAGVRLEVWVESLPAPSPLFIVGAGADAHSVRRIAREIGFRVTLTDPRRHSDTSKSPDSRSPRSVLADDSFHWAPTPRTAAIIMSHNYHTDYAFLKKLLPINLRYLGLMGPRARAEKMLEDLRCEGFALRPEWLRTFYNPIGLDIGAESPEQIALAIVAEIQAALAGRPGRSLREKKGPIHGPPP